MLYEAPATAIEGLKTDRPTVLYTHDGKDCELTADFVAGCDGFHGISRQAIHDPVLKTHDLVYPFGWLGILANTPPSKEVALFSHNERGFALLSMRSHTVGRFYLQCATDENLDEWPDDRI